MTDNEFNWLFSFQSECPITQDELAKRLGICRSTIWRWCKYGRIKGYKLGNKGTVYFIPSELNDMIPKARENGYITKKFVN
jgi:excisionase family DNA binding protein